MATEKILNTKVLLRYDTLANWQKTDITNGGANYVPKKGEACVYEIPTGASVDGVKNPPAIMIKVGNGTSKVSALPWTAATAADVYAWAKKSGIEFEEGTGDYVTGLSWNGTTNKIVVTKASFDNSGNVKFSKTETGNVKATVSISDVKVDNALHAETADSATAAGKATNDGAGNSIVDTYATKAEIAAKENLWTKDTVTTVTGKDAIKVQDADTDNTSHDYKVELVINAGTPGNVTLTQDANGLKANTTPEAIGAVSTADFGTFKTDNTTAISTAKSGAIAAAAEDATTKANTAKTEAIAAAAEDATTKANTAESNAKKYTNDEIVGLELEHSGQSIILKNKAGTTVATLDASAFYVDGMVSDATYNATTNKLTITFNTAAGKNAIDVDLNDLVDVYTGGTGITVGTDGKISITDGGVGTTQLADKAVTKAKLADEVLGDLGEKTVKTYVDDAIAGVVGGEVTNAKHADEATKATQDGDGNVITATYETKTDASAKLAEAKKYTDDAIAGLDVTDTAETNKYVSAVSETDGKISVSRETLPVYSVTAENKQQTVTVINGEGAVVSGKVLKVNGTELVEIVSVEGVSEIAAQSIRALDYNTKTSNHIEAAANYGALVDFTVEDGLITTIERNSKLTGYIEDLDQRESSVLVLFGGSATENI